MPSLMFLTLESPWPAYSGIQKRALGLLSELARAYPIDLWLLPREPLTNAQEHELYRCAQSVTQIPRRDISLRDKLAVAIKAIVARIPYHAAVVEHSFAANPSLYTLRPKASDRVYANLLHWTVPLKRTAGSRWILDQPDADVQFWEVYARQSANSFVRFVALANRRLTDNYCTQVYPNLACIVSVCKEDRDLTRQISPATRVEVIPNGVDCDYFLPARLEEPGPTLLFTGTSAERNMKALRYFIKEVYPLVRREVSNVQLVVGGNFSPAAQSEFAGIPGISFTGKVPDLRPIYNRCAVFVNPFEEAHGSKLKVSEALAMGICTVSLLAGVRGMPVVDGQSVLIGQDGPHMARQIVRALTDSSLANRIGRNGRRAAETYLDWRRALGPRLRNVVAQVVDTE
jgi:glycosyltransferase involved in cell wall biosynthesis